MTEEAVAAPDRCAFTFALGHVSISCGFEPELEDVARSFAQPMDQASLPPSKSSLAVSVQRGVGTPPASRGLALTCAFGDSKGYTEPGRLELWDGSSLVAAELDGTSVRGAVGAESDHHVVGAVMLFATTALALRAHGLFHLHAACVDVPGLGTLLLVGESGSGKTTLSLGLAALGGRLVSDDAVFVSREQGVIEVWGWPADLHLAPATLGAFPELAAHASRPVSDGRDKRAVPLAALGRPWLPCARQPKLVLFPTVGAARDSRVKRLDAAETVARLIPQSGLALVPGAARCEEHLRLLAEVADAAVGLEITLGVDALAPGPLFLDWLQAKSRGT